MPQEEADERKKGKATTSFRWQRCTVTVLANVFFLAAVVVAFQTNMQPMIPLDANTPDLEPASQQPSTQPKAPTPRQPQQLQSQTSTTPAQPYEPRVSSEILDTKKQVTSPAADPSPKPKGPAPMRGLSESLPTKGARRSKESTSVQSTSPSQPPPSKRPAQVTTKSSKCVPCSFELLMTL